MLENVIERELVKAVKNAGGEIRKVKWIGRRNAPDRIVFLRGVRFVELKRPGQKPRVGQVREIAAMEKHGARVFVIDSVEKVHDFIEGVLNGC